MPKWKQLKLLCYSKQLTVFIGPGDNCKCVKLFDIFLIIFPFYLILLENQYIKNM